MNLRIFSAQEVKEALPMSAAIDAMRSAFAQLASAQVHMPLRSATKNPRQDATTLCMPAYLENSQQLGVKIVSIFPHNLRVGLATINGIVITINAKTGQPEAILEGSTLTAIRTGAVSGLATDLLAAKDASSVAILGTGAQAYSQLEAVCCVRDIKKVYVYSRSLKNAQCFANNIQSDKVVITATDVVREATQHADIICTATPSTSPIVDLADVKPGVHINAVGSHTHEMMELSTALLAAAKVYVDERAAALAEAGEIIHAIQANALQADQLYELGQLILNARLGRESPQQITVFKSVGLAIQDVSAASAALENAAHGTMVAFS